MFRSAPSASPGTDALRQAVEAAIRAPSVHNTQPWSFHLDADGVLEVHLDRSRQLHVLDPDGRQLGLSVGCAIFNIRVALAAAGWEADVRLVPEVTYPDLAARIWLRSTDIAWRPLGTLEPWIIRRRTNRRAFMVEPMRPEVAYQLVEAASVEGAELLEITDPVNRARVLELSRIADASEVANPAYRAEVRAWSTDEPHRVDGVPWQAVPHVNGPVEPDDFPMRDFDSSGIAWLPTIRGSGHQCLMLLGTYGDTMADWLRAGEALERVLLAATQAGYVASPLNQVVEVRYTRERLRSELSLSMHPHLLLRIGRAPMTRSTPRRPLEDVLDDERALPGSGR